MLAVNAAFAFGGFTTVFTGFTTVFTGFTTVFTGFTTVFTGFTVEPQQRYVGATRPLGAF